MRLEPAMYEFGRAESGVETSASGHKDDMVLADFEDVGKDCKKSA